MSAASLTGAYTPMHYEKKTPVVPTSQNMDPYPQNPYGVPPAPPPRPGQLEFFVGRAQDAEARIRALVHQAATLNARLYGPRLEDANAGCAQSAPESVLGRMEYVTDGLHNALDALMAELDRLKGL